MNELTMYSQGLLSVPRDDRAVAQRAKSVYDDTRLAAYQVTGMLQVGAHIMTGMVQLDGYRRQLAGDDPFLNDMCLAIEANTLRNVANIHNGMFRGAQCCGGRH